MPHLNYCVKLMRMKNYDLELTNLITEIKLKKQTPTLLLQSCCAPCSTTALSRLSEVFKITVYYYNPCLYPDSEFEKRKNEQVKLISILNEKLKNKIELIVPQHNEQAFLEIAKGLENQPEGGGRCYKCYTQRLENTAKQAKLHNFDYFGTTLSVSPYKHADWLNEIGYKMQAEYGVNFLPADFKKQNGYLFSINESKRLGLYRQDYCGCRFSLYSKNENKNN